VGFTQCPLLWSTKLSVKSTNCDHVNLLSAKREAGWLMFTRDGNIGAENTFDYTSDAASMSKIQFGFKLGATMLASRPVHTTPGTSYLRLSGPDRIRNCTHATDVHHT
jgi:hypothetical protein